MDEGRSRVANGHFLLLLICVLMLFLPVCYAYGDTYDGGGGGSHNIGGDDASASSSSPWGEFWYGPNSYTSEGVKRWKTGVVAWTSWDAALYALGYSQSVIDGISAAKKVKLMDSNTGGYYYTFAKAFKVGRPTEDAGNPVAGWNPSSMLTAWYAAKAMYGETYCYWQVYSDTMRQHARDSADAIIKGGSETGGGSDGNAVYTLDRIGNVSGSYTNYTAGNVSYSETGRPVFSGLSGGTSVDYGGQVKVSVSKEVLDAANAAASTNDYDKFLVIYYTYGFRSSDSTYAGILAYNSDITEIEQISKGYRIKKTGGDASSNHYGIFGSSYSTCLNGVFYMNNNNGRANSNYGFATSSSRDITVWYATEYGGDSTGSGGGNEGDDEPDPPEWPKPPADPPVPVLPPPGDPVTPVDPPDPTTPDPTVDPPTDPWVPWTPESDGGTGTDIQAILDAMNRHCIHLQDAIEYNVEQLYELQRTYLTDNFSAVRDAITDNFNALMDYLKDAFDWLGNDVIIASFTDLKDYLHQLFEWLSDTLNVSTESYDDTSVLYWLRQIWGKLGGGISVKPVDPSIDNDGWWDWFANLLGGLIGALADIGLDKIGGLVDALDTLKDKFPFCIPWDIAALLGLLVSEPVTPVVQVPLMALSVSDGVQEVGTMTIDLTPYDDVWDAVRWIERIAFCVYLATRTKDFLDLLGKIKG